MEDLWVLCWAENGEKIVSPTHGGPRCLTQTGEDVRSICEYRPTDAVAASLVLQDDFSDLIGKLPALPVSFSLARSRMAGLGCLGGLDGIGGGTEIVLGDMAHAGRLASGESSKTSSSTQRPGRTHGVPAHCAGLHHGHLATSPRSCSLDRLAGTQVRWLLIFEQVQHVLCASGGPNGQELMILIGERPAPADSYQARVPQLGKDHTNSLSLLSAAG